MISFEASVKEEFAFYRTEKKNNCIYIEPTDVFTLEDLVSDSACANTCADMSF